MTVPAHEALALLKEGNRRFAGSSSRYRFAADERAASTEGQSPWAVVVGCSDSRVPVEAVFDAGVGDLFVVRTAGHVLAEASLASVRFAVEKLGSRLVVVLGHEDCGAVSAALSGDAPLWLQPIVSHIEVDVPEPGDLPEGAREARMAAAVSQHVEHTAEQLRRFVARFGLEDEVLVAGGAYHLASGEVHWIDETGH